MELLLGSIFLRAKKTSEGSADHNDKRNSASSSHSGNADRDSDWGGNRIQCNSEEDTRGGLSEKDDKLPVKPWLGYYSAVAPPEYKPLLYENGEGDRLFKEPAPLIISKKDNHVLHIMRSNRESAPANNNSDEFRDSSTSSLDEEATIVPTRVTVSSYIGPVETLLGKNSYAANFFKRPTINSEVPQNYVQIANSKTQEYFGLDQWRDNLHGNYLPTSDERRLNHVAPSQASRMSSNTIASQRLPPIYLEPKQTNSKSTLKSAAADSSCNIDEFLGDLNISDINSAEFVDFQHYLLKHSSEANQLIKEKCFKSLQGEESELQLKKDITEILPSDADFREYECKVDQRVIDQSNAEIQELKHRRRNKVTFTYESGTSHKILQAKCRFKQGEIVLVDKFLLEVALKPRNLWRSFNKASDKTLRKILKLARRLDPLPLNFGNINELGSHKLDNAHKYLLFEATVHILGYKIGMKNRNQAVILSTGAKPVYSPDPNCSCVVLDDMLILTAIKELKKGDVITIPDCQASSLGYVYRLENIFEAKREVEFEVLAEEIMHHLPQWYEKISKQLVFHYDTTRQQWLPEKPSPSLIHAKNETNKVDAGQSIIIGKALEAANRPVVIFEEFESIPDVDAEKLGCESKSYKSIQQATNSACSMVADPASETSVAGVLTYNDGRGKHDFDTTDNLAALDESKDISKEASSSHNGNIWVDCPVHHIAKKGQTGTSTMEVPLGSGQILPKQQSLNALGEALYADQEDPSQILQQMSNENETVPEATKDCKASDISTLTSREQIQVRLRSLLKMLKDARRNGRLLNQLNYNWIACNYNHRDILGGILYLLLAKHFISNAAANNISGLLINISKSIETCCQCFEESLPLAINYDLLPIVITAMRLSIFSGSWKIFGNLCSQGYLERIRYVHGHWSKVFISFNLAQQHLLHCISSKATLNFHEMYEFAYTSQFDKTIITEDVEDEISAESEMHESHFGTKQSLSRASFSQLHAADTISNCSYPIIHKCESFDRSEKSAAAKQQQAAYAAPLRTDVTKSHPDSLLNRYMFPQDINIPGGNFKTVSTVYENLAQEKKIKEEILERQASAANVSEGDIAEKVHSVTVPMIQFFDPLYPFNGNEILDSKGMPPASSLRTNEEYIDYSKLMQSEDGKFPVHEFFASFFHIDPTNNELSDKVDSTIHKEQSPTPSMVTPCTSANNSLSYKTEAAKKFAENRLKAAALRKACQESIKRQDPTPRDITEMIIQQTHQISTSMKNTIRGILHGEAGNKITEALQSAVIDEDNTFGTLMSQKNAKVARDKSVSQSYNPERDDLLPESTDKQEEENIVNKAEATPLDDYTSDGKPAPVNLTTVSLGQVAAPAVILQPEQKGEEVRNVTPTLDCSATNSSDAYEFGGLDIAKIKSNADEALREAILNFKTVIPPPPKIFAPRISHSLHKNYKEANLLGETMMHFEELENSFAPACVMVSRKSREV